MVFGEFVDSSVDVAALVLLLHLFEFQFELFQFFFGFAAVLLQSLLQFFWPKTLFGCACCFGGIRLSFFGSCWRAKLCSECFYEMSEILLAGRESFAKVIVEMADHFAFVACLQTRLDVLKLTQPVCAGQQLVNNQNQSRGRVQRLLEFKQVQILIDGSQQMLHV